MQHVHELVPGFVQTGDVKLGWSPREQSVVAHVPLRGGNFEGYMEVPVEHYVKGTNYCLYGGTSDIGVRRRIGPANLVGFMFDTSRPLTTPLV